MNILHSVKMAAILTAATLGQMSGSLHRRNRAPPPAVKKVRRYFCSFCVSAEVKASCSSPDAKVSDATTKTLHQGLCWCSYALSPHVSPRQGCALLSNPLQPLQMQTSVCPPSSSSARSSPDEDLMLLFWFWIFSLSPGCLTQASIRSWYVCLAEIYISKEY